MYLLLGNLNSTIFLHNYTTYVMAEFVNHFVDVIFHISSLDDP
jgi:hypothetical protein